MAAIYAGLMSGTSTDGVDGVLASFDTPNRPTILASCSIDMPTALRQELLALNLPGNNELARAAIAANSLARLYAQAINRLMEQSGVAPSDVAAIGAHGQTVRHAPEQGYTIQLNAPALLAELTSVDVIADFRTRDVAAGGQGAPLVPAFHHALFYCDHPRAVLNLGGIANVTLIAPDTPVRGFDTGPANALLDLWCQSKTGAAYDAQGQWAATGKVCEPLLGSLIASEPWFGLPPPKSTGRDLFNARWLQQRLAGYTKLGDVDIQATLQALTAQTVANAIDQYAPQTQEVLVCGGGALNNGLMHDLATRLKCPIHPTSDFGVHEQMVEALAFAWLAWAYDNNQPAGLPSVTGARHSTILGARYPAGPTN